MKSVTRSFIIFCLGINTFINLAAQNTITVSGVVVNEKRQPLSNVTVSIFKANSKDTVRRLSGQNGRYSFSNISRQQIGIKTQSVGYQTNLRWIDIPENSNFFNVDTIQLEFSVTILQSVTVTTNKSLLIKEDTVEYRADSFKVKPNALVEDLLKKLPGIQVDKNGNVTAHGKTVNKIKVDGKDFFGGDVKTATQQLPADIIDKIQVIDDYGDQALFTGVKDGDPQKVLNLQIKKDKNTGYFGNANIGKGTEDRYQVNGALFRFRSTQQISVISNFNNTGSNLFNFSAPGLGGGGQGGMMGGLQGSGMMGGQQGTANRGGTVAGGSMGNNDGLTDTKSMGLNFRDQWGKKVSFYGSYQYSSRSNITESIISQQNIFANGANLNLQNNTTTSDGLNHRISLNIEYQIDSLNYLKVTPSINLQDNEVKSITDFETSNSGRKTNQGAQQNISNTTAPNFSGNILFNHRFQKKGRNLLFNLSISSVETDQTDDNKNLSTFFLPSGLINNTNQMQFIEQDNINDNYGVRISYNEPIQKNKNLELNYSYNRQNIGNDRINYVYDPVIATYVYADSLSNLYDNDYHTHRFGFNYRVNTKKISYTIGLGVQPAIMNSNSTSDKQSFTQYLINYFPVARFTYQFSRSRSFDLNYSGRTQQPSYNQLQPVTDNSNQQFIVTGNPLLRPEFTNTLNIRYNNFDYYTGDVFFSNVSFSFTNDKIVNNTFNKGLGVQETRYLNTNGFYSGTAFYYYSKPLFKKKLKLNFNGSVGYNNNISFIDSISNTAKNLVVSQGLSLDMTAGEWLELGITGNYSANNTKNSIQTQPANNTRTYSYGTSIRIDLPGKWILNYTMDKTINEGFGAANVNPLIINTYIEKQLFKETAASLRIQGFDLLNQNVNVTRTVSANAISDNRSNRLGRYFMVSFIFRFASFGGKKISSPLMMMPMGQRSGPNMNL